MDKNPEKVDIKELSNAIRFLSMDAVQKANSGHPGMPMGMADVATVLFTKFLKFDPTDPKWPDRDRFILSAGHGSMLLYSLMYLTGFKDIDIEFLEDFLNILLNCNQYRLDSWENSLCFQDSFVINSIRI